MEHQLQPAAVLAAAAAGMHPRAAPSDGLALFMLFTSTYDWQTPVGAPIRLNRHSYQPDIVGPEEWECPAKCCKRGSPTTVALGDHPYLTLTSTYMV